MPSIPFQARARTVDHLGREQIADCPTAISELWKNAYDAYASAVSLHIFGGDIPLAAVMDDGHGMSEAEFIERWLTLGTDAKVGNRLVSEADRHGLPQRPRQGQKGIGRLSVAYLGPTVIVLSKREGHPFIAALLDWRLFQNPYLTLNDVQVPVESFRTTSSFPDVLTKLFDGLVDNVWGSAADPARQARLTEAWRRYGADEARRGEPSSADQIASLALTASLNQSHLASWSVWSGNREHGTAMFVLDIVQELRVWVSADAASDDPEVISVRRKLQMTLRGFADPLLAPPVLSDGTSGISASDRFSYLAMAHTGDTEQRIVSSTETFDLNELNELEHVVDGEIDELGVFRGRVKAWDKELGVVTILPDRAPPLRGAGHVGSFKVTFGTFEQSLENSTHTADQHTRLIERAKAFSGLAVYRDGLRVQPYGRPENDFFGFEERRAKHQGREYWASRKTFGRVALTRSANPRLRDKAGREGFIDNRAAREFRLLVVGLFKTLARRYFGNDAELREVETSETQARHARSKAAETRARRKRTATLKRALKDHAPKLPGLLVEANALAEVLEDHTRPLEVDVTASRLTSLQQRRRALALPPRPRKLTAAVESRYRAYRDQFNEVTATIEAVSARWSERTQAESAVPPEEAARSALGRQQKLITDATGRWLRDIEAALGQEKARWKARVAEDNPRYYQLVSPVLADLIAERIPLAAALAELEASRARLYDELAPEYEGYLRALNTLSEGIDMDAALSWATDERAVLTSQVAQWQDLAQLGITVEIIGHELNDSAAQVSRNLTRLPRAAKQTQAFTLAHTGFHHLVQRLRFLSPLRLSGAKSRAPVSGREIYEYLGKFFAPQLKSRNIDLVATPVFLATNITVYRHRIYPVFTNVVNNALYWVMQGEERRVVLDRRGADVIIADTGPGIDPADEQELFRLFFSRKVGGHGVGLYLSRLALEQGRNKIRLATPSERILPGANFILTFRELTDA